MMSKVELESNIPEELKRERGWVGWAPDPDTGRPKCPVLVSAKSRRASTRKPETWTTFDRAVAFQQKYGDGKTHGIGYVFIATQGLVYLDIDCAVEPNGELREWAKPFVEPFIDRAYMELSPSGTGLHIITKGSLPGTVEGGVAKFPEHAVGERVPEVAIFCGGKYTTITGNVWKGQKRPRSAEEQVLGVWEAAGIEKGQGGHVDAGKAPSDEALAEVAKVPKTVAAELRKCRVMDAPDRSSARFKFYVEAAKAGLTPEETFSLVINSDWYTASGADEKGREHTWQDIHRAASKATTAANEFEAFKDEDEKRAKAVAASWKDLGVAVTVQMTKGGPVTSAAYGLFNMALVLEKHPTWAGRLKHNRFKDRIELDGREFDEHEVGSVAEALRSYLEWDREPQLDLVFKAVQTAAKRQSYDPMQEWLTGLTWDGTARVESWLAAVGCEDTPLNRVIGKKWLVSLVARALKPGCKVDTVLVLEGEQGEKKSTLFRVLAGGAEYFTDAHVGMDKDGMMLVHGRWLVELAELASFKRAEREVVKAFIAAQENSYRPPYARNVVTQPRHFLLVGSTNDDQYLTDPSGARRYWPVKVTRKLDVKWVELHREQLFAEAVALLNTGEEWWFDEMPKELAEAHEARFQADAFEDKVAEFVREVAPHSFTLSQLMERHGWSLDRRDVQMRLAEVLKRLGLKRQRVLHEGARSWRWMKPSWPQLVAEELDDVLAAPPSTNSVGKGSR